MGSLHHFLSGLVAALRLTLAVRAEALLGVNTPVLSSAWALWRAVRRRMVRVSVWVVMDPGQAAEVETVAGAGDGYVGEPRRGRSGRAQRGSRRHVGRCPGAG